MAYFPMYVEMTHLKVLMVGGGTVAGKKLEKLLDFTANITVVSPEITKHVQHLIDTHALEFCQRTYRTGDIEGYDIVIVATDTAALHKEIYEESRGKRILVNSVDNTDYCDFIFSSYVQKGDLTIAFSTGGISPAFAKKMRVYFEKNIPDSVGAFLDRMKNLRKTMPKGKERMAYFDTLIDRYFSQHFK